MAKTNQKPSGIKTHEGAKAKRVGADLMLKRSVMACMLWEDEFYEDGKLIADRITDLCGDVDNEKIAQYAIEARNKQHLRHVPLLLAVNLARKRYNKTADVIAEIVQRPDEMSELLSLYWGKGKSPIASQVKKGLARSFVKFNEYQLAKYNRDEKIKLRDVLFLSHAKPKDEAQAALWKRLIAGTMATPDTWEVNLSAGENKRETWERLIAENKLGAMAYLRNLRNMQRANVDWNTIDIGLSKLNVEKVLPFRFIAAARYAPSLEPTLEKLMFKCLEGHDKLSGHTVLLVDVSGSMDTSISSKSEMLRLDAAYGLAMLLREVCERVSIYTFSEDTVEIKPRRGFALKDEMHRSQRHSGTYLGRSLKQVKMQFTVEGKPDRIIVITDEQSHDNVGDPDTRGYMINVASNRNGVGYHSWLHIDGWSEAIVDYIMAYEKEGRDEHSAERSQD